MDELTFLQNIDWYEWFIIFVAITLVVKFLYKTYVEDIIIKHGWESAKMRQKREDHELLLKTSQGLLALQEKHDKDESHLEECLKSYIEETRKENELLRNEMRQFGINRSNDREVSKEREKRLNDRIDTIIDTDKSRDSKIDALIEANKEILAEKINEKYKYYISIKGIPEDEYDEFVSMHKAYNGVGGNHHGDAKFNYCKNHLSVLPVESKLIKRDDSNEQSK